MLAVWVCGSFSSSACAATVMSCAHVSCVMSVSLLWSLCQLAGWLKSAFIFSFSFEIER